jgi:hypothetical protein
MKKIALLVAIAAGVAWAVGRTKTAPPADAWAKASDQV